MQYIEIAGCGKPVSRLMKGTDYFFHNNYEQVCENLDAFIAIGGNSLDTAFIYCGGESEAVIGKYMQERNNREQMVVLTKGGHHNHEGSRLHREALDEEIAISLERLQTSYIDLYALHRDDVNVPVASIIDSLNIHIDAGRIHAIGTSNWTVERIQEANEYAAANGLIGFTFNSPNLSLAKPNEPYWKGAISADDAAIAWHEQTQMPLLSWSSQARGFFTGLYSPEVKDNEDLVRVFYSDDNWERLARAKQLGEEMGVSMIQIALAYVMNQPYPTCALIGARNEAELQSCEVGAEIVLTREQLDWLDLKA